MCERSLARQGLVERNHAGRKRRVESLPKPNRLARIFYRPELEDLVRLMETGILVPT